MDHLAYNMEISDIPITYNNYERIDPVHKCQVTLKNADLWKKFHNLETEMIITKSGRRMFPALQVQVNEIDPQAMYCVFLEMVSASRCRYKYSSAGGWTPAGSEEAQCPHRIYLHPESPAKGEYWMSQPISFGRLKLTNMPAPPAGQIVLSSMHKYQPRIIIANTSDPRTIAWSPSTYVAFPETQFIAVTAYQNEKITQLKIDNNPFAKGFRQNGQAKCKRKRCAEEDKEDELICVTDDQDDSEENNNQLNNSIFSTSDGSINSPVSLSPRSRSYSEGEKVSDCSSPLPFQNSPTVKCGNSEELINVSSRPNQITPCLEESTVSLRSTYYPYSINSQVYLPVNSYYPYFPAQQLPASYNMQYYYHPYARYNGSNMEGMTSSQLYPQRIIRRIEKPKKVTDFSIKALLGC